MKQTFVRLATTAALAGIALAAGGAAWAHAEGGCMGAQQGTAPKAEAQRPGPQGQGMRGMGMGMSGMAGNHVAMAERMARMHGEGAARPDGAMPCRDGATPSCPQEEHKH